MINVPNNFKTITIRWPNKPGIPAIAGFWHRLPDGHIEAKYTRDELPLVLKILEEVLSHAPTSGDIFHPS